MCVTSEKFCELFLPVHSLCSSHFSLYGMWYGSVVLYWEGGGDGTVFQEVGVNVDLLEGKGRVTAMTWAGLGAPMDAYPRAGKAASSIMFG